MKVKCIALSLILLVAATAGFGYVPAQAVVDVPFDFQAGASALPAGTYVVDATRAEENGTIWIRNRETGRQIAVMSRAGGKASVPSENLVIFHQYGDRYFLAEYRHGESALARVLPIPVAGQGTSKATVLRVALGARK